jgi:signal transduction histidine kinase
VLLLEALRGQLDDIRVSHESLVQLQRQLLRSREEERGRLARDLHDGPIQTLVGINMQLGMLLPALKPEQAAANASIVARHAHAHSVNLGLTWDAASLSWRCRTTAVASRLPRSKIARASSCEGQSS